MQGDWKGLFQNLSHVEMMFRAAGWGTRAPTALIWAVHFKASFVALCPSDLLPMAHIMSTACNISFDHENWWSGQMRLFHIDFLSP